MSNVELNQKALEHNRARKQGDAIMALATPCADWNHFIRCKACKWGMFVVAFGRYPAVICPRCNAERSVN